MESYIYMKGGVKMTKPTSKEKQRQMIIAYYRRNPDVFLERELGIKLTNWQKFFLKHMMRLKDGEESR